jgi:hypothetical protein
VPGAALRVQRREVARQLLPITTRLRAENGDADVNVATLADLLRETAEHHDSFEKAAPEHNWWDWYAAYLHARQNSASIDDAVLAADRYMADVKHVVVPSS